MRVTGHRGCSLPGREVPLPGSATRYRQIMSEREGSAYQLRGSSTIQPSKRLMMRFP